MFYFVGLQAQETASQVSLSELFLGVGWGGGQVIQKLVIRVGGVNIKRLLLRKANQISQVKEFSVFLSM